MSKLKKQLQEEKIRLEKILKTTEERLVDAPEGKLRIGKCQGTVQYYHRRKDTSNTGSYISKNKMELVTALAQKQYDERIAKLARKRLQQINRILQDYEDDEILRLYAREHPERRKLIQPVEQSFEKKLKQWMSEPYKGKPFKEDSPVILTNKGLRVRSKTEKIMADYFDSKGICYKYECPLYLNNFGYVYPDFTFLSPKTTEEIYWEHEGMMDNTEYAQAAVKKIDLYEQNNIFPGERLILTFETSATAINSKLLKIMTEKYLLDNA